MGAHPKHKRVSKKTIREAVGSAEKSVHDQISTIESQIFNLSQFFEKKIREPSDVFSRVLLKIPIIRSIFRSILK